MHKLSYFFKTLSQPSRNLFSNTSPIPYPRCRSSVFVQFLRSCDFHPSTGDSGQATMASSATSKLPALDEGFAKRLWIKYKNEWMQALLTPFVVCLTVGNLKIDSFRHYITQDVYFLRAFAKAYEMAEECTDDDDAKVGISELRKNVLAELKMHDSFVQEWGLDLSKECSTPTAATIKYTEFIHATASGNVEGVKPLGKLATPFEKTKLAAYTLGAMVPCMRLYAFLGKELLLFLDPSGGTHPYRKWIDNYSSEAFQAATLQIEDLLDKLSVSLTGEELDIIEKLYRRAIKMETEFFVAQPIPQKTVFPLSKEHNRAVHRLMLFSDFDLTCTVLDSSAVLAEIAIRTALKSDQNQPETQLAQMSSADLKKSWEELSKQYSEEYEQCIESILVSNKGKKFNYEVLHKALEQLSEFEKRANSRVIESGVLKGLSADDVKRAGARLILQDGCANFFQNAVNNEKLNTNIHILSYCWCGDLIRSAFSSVGLESVDIHANELVYEKSCSTGEIVTKVQSPIDKVKAFTNILENCGKNRRIQTVYIGDSMGDMLCLLKADIGIVVGSSESLRRLGIHFGVTFVPLFRGLIEKQKQFSDDESFSSPWKGLSGVLYTVDSWAEIHSFILGS